MKNKEIWGVIFGFILFIAWIVILNGIAFVFLSEKNTLNGTVITKIRDFGQIFNWLATGMIPFFFVAGHYLLYNGTANGTERINNIIAMQSTFIGFLIWLLVVVMTFLLKIESFLWDKYGRRLLYYICYIFNKDVKIGSAHFNRKC